MRSIGVKNINLVKRVARAEVKRMEATNLGMNTFTGLEDNVMSKLPLTMFHTWEMAFQEINNLINEVLMEGAP